MRHAIKPVLPVLPFLHACKDAIHDSHANANFSRHMARTACINIVSAGLSVCCMALCKSAPDQYKFEFLPVSAATILSQVLMCLADTS